MQTAKNKHKSKFDLTVEKTCDKKKLVVFFIRYINFVIKEYIKKERRKQNALVDSHFHHNFSIN